MVGEIGKLAWLLAVPATLSLTGCANFYAAEPVIQPPKVYWHGTTVPVEFVEPSSIGARCAERGAKFLGMPGVNSLACSNADLITMPNPCLLANAGWYAKAMCHEIAHVNGWPASHKGGSLALFSAPASSEGADLLALQK